MTGVDHSEVTRPREYMLLTSVAAVMNMVETQETRKMMSDVLKFCVRACSRE